MTPTPPATTGGPDTAVEWLSAQEQAAWRTVSLLLLQLPAPLDAQLQRDAGITFFEYLVLGSLSMTPTRSLRMSELAGLANGSLSRLSNVAKRLEQRGWLERTPDPDDGRYTIAHLTDDGFDVVRAAAPGHVETVRRLLIAPLTTVEISTLAGMERRVADNLRCPGAADPPPC